MKTNILRKSVALFVSAIALAMPAAYAITCTPQSTSPILTPNVPQIVNYTCSPIGRPYVILSFPSPQSWLNIVPSTTPVSPGSPQSVTMTVTSGAPAGGSVSVAGPSTISIGGGGETPVQSVALTVNIAKPAPSTPVIFWSPSDANVKATLNYTSPAGIAVSWNANAKIIPAKPITYSVSYTDSANPQKVISVSNCQNLPATSPSCNISAASLTAQHTYIVSVTAAATGAKSVDNGTSAIWSPPQVSGTLTCDSPKIDVNGKTTCTLILNNQGSAASGVKVETHGTLLYGTLTPQTTGTCTGNGVPAASGTTAGSCTMLYTYAGTKPGTDSIQLDYTDAQGERLTTTPAVSIVVSPLPMPKVSGKLTCPNSVFVSSQSTCTLALSNAGNAPATSVQLSPSALDDQQKAFGQLTPSGNVCTTVPVGPDTCTVTYTYVAPSSAGTANLSVGYTDGEQETMTVGPVVVAVNVQPTPHVSGSWSCTKTTLTLGQTPAQTSACTLKLSNTGDASAPGVSNVTPGTPTYGTLVLTTASPCSSVPAATGDTPGTCTLDYTYTPTTAGTDSVSIAYKDGQGSVTITGSPVSITVNAEPTIDWGDSTVTATPNYQATPQRVDVIWGPATDSSKAAVSYTVKLNDTDITTDCDLTKLTCAIPNTSLITGTAYTVTVTASANDAASVPNSAKSFTWQPPSPDVSGSIVCVPPTVVINGNSTCTLTLKNESIAAATQIAITPKATLSKIALTLTGTTCIADVTKSGTYTLSGNTSCALTYAYTAPDSTAGSPDIISMTYADEQKDTVNIPTASITIGAQISWSGNLSVEIAGSPLGDGVNLLLPSFAEDSTGQDIKSPTQYVVTLDNKPNGNPIVTKHNHGFPYQWIDVSSLKAGSNTIIITVTDPVTSAKDTKKLEFVWPPAINWATPVVSANDTPGKQGITITWNATAVLSTDSPIVPQGSNTIVYQLTLNDGSPVTIPNTDITGQQGSYSLTADELKNLRATGNVAKISATLPGVSGVSVAPVSGQSSAFIWSPPAPNVTGSWSCTKTTLTLGQTPAQTSACTLALSNTGNAPSDSGVVTPGAPKFGTLVPAPDSGDCSAVPAATGDTPGTCTLDYTYTPTTAGTDSVSIAYKDGQGPVMITGSPVTMVVSQPSISWPSGKSGTDANVVATPSYSAIAADNVLTVTWNDSATGADNIQYAVTKIVDDTGAAIDVPAPCAASSTLKSCSIPSTGTTPLVNGKTYTVTVTASVIGGGVSPVSNTASAPWSPPTPNVSGSIACLPPSVVINGQSICTLTLKNAGNAEATQIAITPKASLGQIVSAPTDPGTTCVSDATKQGTYTLGSNASCTLAYTYTAPGSAGSSAAISMSYADAQNDTVNIPTVSVPITEKPTVVWSDANVQITAESDASHLNITWNTNATVNGSSTNVQYAVTSLIDADKNSVTIPQACSTPLHTLNVCAVVLPTVSKSHMKSYTATVTASDPTDDATSFPQSTQPVPWLNIFPSVAPSATNCPATVQAGDQATCNFTFENKGIAIFPDGLGGVLGSANLGYDGNPEGTTGCNAVGQSGGSCVITYKLTTVAANTLGSGTGTATFCLRNTNGACDPTQSVKSVNTWNYTVVAAQKITWSGTPIAGGADNSGITFNWATDSAVDSSGAQVSYVVSKITAQFEGKDDPAANPEVPPSCSSISPNLISCTVSKNDLRPQDTYIITVQASAKDVTTPVSSSNLQPVPWQPAANLSLNLTCYPTTIDASQSSTCLLNLQNTGVEDVASVVVTQKFGSSMTPAPDAVKAPNKACLQNAEGATVPAKSTCQMGYTYKYVPGDKPPTQDSVQMQSQDALKNVVLSNTVTMTINAASLPTVTGLPVATGPAAGGTSITIAGTNFTGATAVNFGSTAATSFHVGSATSIDAVSPAGTGQVDVRVTTPAGTSAIVAADQFTYQAAAPSVTGKAKSDCVVTVQPGKSFICTFEFTNATGNLPGGAVGVLISPAPGSGSITPVPIDLSDCLAPSGPSCRIEYKITVDPDVPQGSYTSTATYKAAQFPDVTAAVPASFNVGPAQESVTISWNTQKNPANLNPNPSYSSPGSLTVSWAPNATTTPQGKEVTYTVLLDDVNVPSCINLPSTSSSCVIPNTLLTQLGKIYAIAVMAQATGADPVSVNTTIPWMPGINAAPANCTPNPALAGTNVSCTLSFKTSTGQPMPDGTVTVKDTNGYVINQPDGSSCIAQGDGSCTSAFTVKIPSSVPSTVYYDQLSTIYTSSAYSSYSGSAPSAGISITSSPLPNSGGNVTAAIMVNTCGLPPAWAYIGQVSGTPAAESPVNCGIQFTNNGTSSIAISSVSAVGGGGAAILTNPMPCGSTIGPTGGGCSAMVNFTPTYPLSAGNPTEVTIQITPPTGKPISYTVPVIMTSGLSMSAMTCTPNTVVAGTASKCTFTINNTVVPIPQAPLPSGSPVVQPLADGKNDSAFVFTSFNTSVPPLPTGATVVTLTYTAPSNLKPDTVVNLSAQYSDSLGQIISIPVTQVTVGSALTMSGVRCNPEVPKAGASMACSVFVNNVSSVIQTNLLLKATFSGGSGLNTLTSSCLSNLAPNQSCQVPFTATAGSGSSMAIGIEGDKGTAIPLQTTIIPVVLPTAHVQGNPVWCLPSSSNTWTCTESFSNLGSAAVDGVSIGLQSKVTEAGGSASITDDCSGSIAPYGSCTATIQYTMPQTIKSGYDKIVVTYKDSGSNVPAFIRPVIIPLSASQADLSYQPASGYVPPSGAEYNNGCSSTNPLCPIAGATQFKFLFTNTGSHAVDPLPKPKVVVVNDSTGDIKDLPASALGGACMVAPSIGKKAACDLSVSFMPAAFNGLSVGDRVTLYAWLQNADSTVASQVASLPFAIGQPPIFSTMLSDRPFLEGTGKYSAAFIFGNSTAAPVTDLRPPRIFLPAGFTFGGTMGDGGCPEALLTYYPHATPCSSTTSDLPATASCYICFSGTSSQNSDAHFEGQLVYHESISTVKQLVPKTATYRQITVVNNCQGPVWAGFVSGATYYACHQQADCPVGSTCDTTAGQCKGGCTQNRGICPNGSWCDTTADAGQGQCFWSSPTDAKNNAIKDWEVAPAGGTRIMQYPNVPRTFNGVWSAVAGGGIVGRTGCAYNATTKTFDCDTASCPVKDAVNGDYSCVGGGAPPATQAEYTFNYMNQDYYDVEVIDGINIPIEMHPTYKADGTTPYDGTPLSSSPYTCAAAGRQLSTSDSAYSANFICKWDYKLQHYDLVGNSGKISYTAGNTDLHTYVSGTVKTNVVCIPGTFCTGTGCSGTTECPVDANKNQLYCGLTQDAGTAHIGSNLPGAPQAPQFSCGRLIGAWSSNKLCASNHDLKYEEFDCTASPGNDTMLNWYGCPSTDAGPAGTSCYQPSKSGNCCGCPFWEYAALSSSERASPDNPEALKNLFPAGFVLNPPDFCYASSTAWVQNIQGPALAWMKSGCASTYTFPYDDPTGTFTCSQASIKNGQINPNMGGVVNNTAYTITFCPIDPDTHDTYYGTVNGIPISTTPSTPPKSSQLNKSRFAFTQKILRDWHTLEQKIKRDFHRA